MTVPDLGLIARSLTINIEAQSCGFVPAVEASRAYS